MAGAGEQLSAERLLRTLQRGKQPDTLGTKIGQALELITTLLDDLGQASVRRTFTRADLIVNVKLQSHSMVGKIVSSSSPDGVGTKLSSRYRPPPPSSSSPLCPPSIPTLRSHPLTHYFTRDTTRSPHLRSPLFNIRNTAYRSYTRSIHVFPLPTHPVYLYYRSEPFFVFGSICARYSKRV